MLLDCLLESKALLNCELCGELPTALSSRRETDHPGWVSSGLPGVLDSSFSGRFLPASVLFHQIEPGKVDSGPASPLSPLCRFLGNHSQCVVSSGTTPTEDGELTLSDLLNGDFSRVTEPGLVTLTGQPPPLSSAFLIC